MKTETEALADLYTTLIDSREGYEEAAEAVDSPHLQSLFEDLSARRAQDAREVRDFLKGADVDLDDDGSILGSAHRQFLELKDSLSGDDEAIIAEVIRGEQHLLDTYDEAIQPMTGESAAYRFAKAHYMSLADRLDDLKGEKRKAA
ncbi:ferritin-like domain-containing protein [Pseudooctadecabacter sp.]|uniref:ferritin-like domain-containing protein n=1 Tax=Pseudooctadecabacter sp. TaxID=1966338 RepID=UPI0025D17086|nr:PA2169 family four-helix-bundle protein [Pseudooctadecabacter sp.]